VRKTIFMKENLILSAVHDLEYDDLAPFLESLRATGSQAKVHFFVARVSKKSLRKFESLGITLHPISYFSIRTRPPLMFFWPLWRRLLATGDFESKCQLAKRVFHLMGLRFIVYYEFLKNRSDSFDKILMTDCRDVYFQRDPFAEDLGPGVHCFLEAASQTLESSWRNREMLVDAFGPEVLAEMGNAPVSCAGATLGDSKSILIYLKAMIETLFLGRRMQSGNDQGVHNYLVHKQLASLCHLHDNYSSLVFTAGCEGSDNITLNEQDEIIRADGKPYAILHQYDRHREIARKLLAKLEAVGPVS